MYYLNFMNNKKKYVQTLFLNCTNNLLKDNRYETRYKKDKNKKALAGAYFYWLKTACRLIVIY